MSVFYHILSRLKHQGSTVTSRGLETKELVGFSYQLPPRVRFMCFEHRKLRMDYVKQEFLWYFNADRYDVSIKKIATMWDGLVNFDGSINSNYGYYIFAKNPETGISNFERVVETLSTDPQSRRATITILDNGHLDSSTNDYPCTSYLNFLIRDNELIMLVRMRSQDAIYGMGNDAPFFSFVQELLHSCLIQDPHLKGLKIGTYYHTADSFHVYERHYNMLDKILADPSVLRDEDAECPAMTPFTYHYLKQTVAQIRKLKPGEQYVDTAHGDPFTTWLLTRDDLTTILPPETV